MAATLRPASGDVSFGYLACVLCGERASSDALLNVILFMPLGVAVGLAGWRTGPSLVGPLLVSLLVELAQLWLPGRDPSIGDVVFNSLGASAGVAAVRTAKFWLKPPEILRPRFLAASVVWALGALGLTGVALQPSFPESTWFGQWAPNQAHIEWYRARVQSVTLGGVYIKSERLDNTALVRQQLERGALLEVRAIAGPPVPAIGSLFSIADDWQREMILLGPDREDIVWRFRTRAADFKLDQPDVRFENAARLLAPGKRATVRVWREPSGWCIEAQMERRCGLGFRLKDGWGLLMFPESLPDWVQSFLDAAWMAGLLLPVGLYSRRGFGSLAAAVVTMGGVLLLPTFTGLLPATPIDVAAAAAGLSGGAALAAALRGRSANG